MLRFVAVCALLVRVSSISLSRRREKKYAYVTMLFDPSLLAHEDAEKLGYHIKAEENRAKWKDTAGISEKSRHLDRSSRHEAEAEFDRDAAPNGFHGRILDPAQILSQQLLSLGSKYPLLVLTNIPEALKEESWKHPNGYEGEETNVIVRFMNDSALLTERHCEMAYIYLATYQKLRMFQQVDFDKLLYLDTDTFVKRNPDHLFDQPTNGNIIGQKCDMWCDQTPGKENVQPQWVQGCRNSTRVWEEWKEEPNHGMCSSVLLFEPSLGDFHGMIEHQKRMKEKDVKCRSDQEIMGSYFHEKSPDKFQFLAPEAALWGRCQFWSQMETDIVHKPYTRKWPREGALLCRADS